MASRGYTDRTGGLWLERRADFFREGPHFMLLKACAPPHVSNAPIRLAEAPGTMAQ